MGILDSVRAFAGRKAAVRRALPPGGQPAAPSRIGTAGPPAGRVMSTPQPSRGLVGTRALDANSNTVMATFARADSGDTRELMDLYEDTRDRDSRLDGVCSKRILAVQGRPLVLSPPPGHEDDTEAQRIAEKAQQLLLNESRGFRRAIGHLAHGSLYGFAVSEQSWRVSRDGLYVPDLLWRHGNRFGFNGDLELGFRLDSRATKLAPLADYPDSFVVHAPTAGRSTYPWRRGAIRSRILPSLGKRFGLRWWLQMMERWGQPQVYAKVPGAIDNDGESDTGVVQSTLEALRNLNSDWAAVFDEGITLDAIPMSGSASAELHKSFIELQNTEDAIRILGQNLTTEVQGGSFAATEAHRFVADDILGADLDELAETLAQQVVEPLIRYNWPGAPVPIVQMTVQRQQPLTLDDVKEGTVTEDQYLASKGYGPKADGQGTEYRRPLSLQVPATLPLPISPGPVAKPGPEGDPTPEGGAEENVQQKALNGAQVTSMVTIIQQIAQGLIPRETGIQLIVAAFPIDEAKADAIIGDVGQGFVPKPEDAPESAAATPPGGADAEAPFGQNSPTRSRSQQRTMERVKAPVSSATSERSRHPLASTLSRR